MKRQFLFILCAASLLVAGSAYRSPVPFDCADGEALVWSSSRQLWLCTAQSTIVTNGGGGSTTVKLSADVTNANGVANTIANVTGLQFPVISGRTYRFRFYVVYTSAAATTGSRWSINGPSFTLLNYTSRYSLTATTQTLNFGMAAYDLPAASNATSLTTGNTAIVEGIITPSANGNVVARFASEVLSSAIVAKAGSYVAYSEY